MPWFKVDDSSYSHPKFRRAGNAALGLWLRCGAYSAQHLLEGIVPALIASDFGTAPQARKLVAVGLWHEQGHDCPRCPQPKPGDYVMHDFFEAGRNSTRAQVEASRKAAADRQAKARAAAAEQQNRSGIGVQSSLNRGPSEVHFDPNRDSSDPRFSGSAAGQEASSRRDGLNGVTPSHAMPHQTTLLPAEEEQASNARDGIADWDTLRDLKRACSANGLGAVAWDLTPSQLERTRQAMEYVGVTAMVDHALGSVRQFGSLPRGASAWVKGWTHLEPAAPGALPPTAGPNVIALPTAGTGRPSTTDLRVQEALEAGRRVQAAMDAQHAQENP